MMKENIGHTDHNLPEAARPRLESQNSITLRLLQNGRQVSNEELQAAGVNRVNSRIADCRKFLKKNGKTIRTSVVDVSRGLYSYVVEELDDHNTKTQ